MTNKQFILNAKLLNQDLKNLERTFNQIIIKRLKEIMDTAEKLYDVGNDKYIEDTNGITKPAFKSLPKIMDKLDAIKHISIETFKDELFRI